MNYFNNGENEEKVLIFRLFANLFMNIPDIEVVEDFERYSGLEISETYEEICNDFIYLFIEENLPNYESYYREILSMDIPVKREFEDVSHFYWTAGIAVDEEVDLPPDHISMELLFMGYIIEQNLAELQVEFLKRICQWIPLFCDELYERAKTDFYKEVATSLKEFVLSECESI